MSEFESSCAKLSSMNVLPVFFTLFIVLVDSFVLYPVPLIICSKLSLFDFGRDGLFSVLHLLVHISPNRK